MAIKEKLVYVVEVVSDGAKSGLKNFTSSIKEAEGAAGKFKAGWGSVVDQFKASPGAITAVGATLGVVAAKAIGDASDLEESINAVNVTFGQSADEVLALGEDAAKGLGLAKSEFNALAVQASSFAKAVAAGTGQPIEQVLGDLTTRIADFASVMNLDLTEATQVFMSTLAGETEPIRKFGKDVSAAAVEQYALASGLIESKSELTENIKVQARYGLLMQQTSDTAGDFANTSDGLANKQRILKAEITNLSAELGQSLIPLATKAAGELEEMASMAADATEDIKGLGKAIAGIPGVPGIVKGWWDYASPAGWVKNVARVEGKVVDLGKSLLGMGGDAKAANELVADGIDNTAQSLHQAEDYTSFLEGRWKSASQSSAEMLGIQRAQAERYADAMIEAGEANQQVALDMDSANDMAAKQEQQLNDTRDAARRLADGTYDLHDAEVDLEHSIKEALEAGKDHTLTMAEQRQKLEGVARSADDVAQAQLELAGVTRESKGGMDMWVTSMLATAETLDGPMREAVLDHISRVSGIPRDVLTNFRAGMDRAALAAIEADLNWTARQRFARIDPVSGGIPRYAGGTSNHPGGLAVINDGSGGELVDLPGGSKVMTASATKSYLNNHGGMSGVGSVPGGGGVFVAPGGIVINGTNLTAAQLERATVDALTSYARKGGSLPFLNGR